MCDTHTSICWLIWTVHMVLIDLQALAPMAGWFADESLPMCVSGPWISNCSSVVTNVLAIGRPGTCSRKTHPVLAKQPKCNNMVPYELQAHRPTTKLIVVCKPSNHPLANPVPPLSLMRENKPFWQPSSRPWGPACQPWQIMVMKITLSLCIFGRPPILQTPWRGSIEKPQNPGSLIYRLCARYCIYILPSVMCKGRKAKSDIACCCESSSHACLPSQAPW